MPPPETLSSGLPQSHPESSSKTAKSNVPVSCKPYVRLLVVLPVALPIPGASVPNDGTWTPAVNHPQPPHETLLRSHSALAQHTRDSQITDTLIVIMSTYKSSSTTAINHTPTKDKFTSLKSSKYRKLVGLIYSRPALQPTSSAAEMLFVMSVGTNQP
jgi:hypothetical protein